MDLLYEKIINNIDTSNSKMDQYVEAVVRSIDALQTSEMIRSAYFTEESEFTESIAQKNSDNAVNDKIRESVGNILSPENGVIGNEAIKKKLADQVEKIKSIDSTIAKMKASGIDPSMTKLQIPNLWTYYEFASALMRDHVEKFTVKNSFKIFGKVVGKDAGIDILTKNFNEMASTIKSYDSGKPKKIDKAARHTGKSGIRRFGEGTLIVTSTLSFGLLGLVGSLAIVRSFFNKCPARIKIEPTTLADTRDKLTLLAPERYETYIKSIIMGASSSVTAGASLEDFTKTGEGPSTAVVCANKLNKLISAYTKFYLATVDFYINICKNSMRMFNV